MQVFLMQNTGGGQANFVEVPEGTTVARLLATHFPGRNPRDFVVLVNRQQVQNEETLQVGDRVVVASDRPTTATVLNENDRVSITPATVKGA